MAPHLCATRILDDRVIFRVADQPGGRAVRFATSTFDTDRSLSLGKAAERALPARTEAVDQEVRVEGEGFVESHARHQRESRASHEAERLVRKGVDDVPG